MPRRPSSPDFKVLKGTFRADRAAGGPPQYDALKREDVSPPDWLKGDGLSAWHDLAEILTAQRVLAASDLYALVQTAALTGRIQEMYRAGEAPKAAELTQLRLLYAEFGLTPASRTRVTAFTIDQSTPNRFAGL